jgi:hypothetical protein
VNLLSKESSSEKFLLGCETTRRRLGRLQNFHQSLASGSVSHEDKEQEVLVGLLSSGGL